jgi:hypothetical protein
LVDLRIEFCKSKARTDRWAEEVELLQEEMKWVKRFFETQACRWAAHADNVGKMNITDLVMAEGLHAYAKEQSAQFCAMRSRCEHLWWYVNTYVVALGQGEVVPKEAEGGDEDETT